MLRVLLVLLLSALLATQTMAGGLYRTTTKDGTVLFSDQRPGSIGKTYKYLGDRLKRGNATASCRGMNEARLAERAAKLESLINRHAESFGVDPALIKAIARVESCFHQQAVSTAGAQGIMQLMPATAKSLGVTDSFNAEQNIRGGTQYFAAMFQRFNYNHRLALAAYNAGPGAVDHYGDIPPYAETQRYVKKVMQRYREYTLTASR